MTVTRGWRFEYIWPDEYLVESDTALVLIAGIRRKQDIPVVLKLVNAAFPLPELRHLKRIRGLPASNTKADPPGGACAEIILTFAPTDAIPGNSIPLDEAVKNPNELCNLTPLLTETVHTTRIWRTRPLTKTQQSASQSLWPTCTSTPVVSQDGDTFTDLERATHTDLIERLLPDSQPAACLANRVLFFDPNRKEVAFSSPVGHSALDGGNPLDHPVMTGMAAIAASQLQPHVKRGPSSTTEHAAGDKEETYLCTGFTVYLLREPCVMCAMALVHARIGSVFFLHPAPGDGALKSVFKLQGVKSLNHHFHVWQAHPPT